MDRKPSENITVSKEELGAVYRQLEAYENHTCAQGSDIMSLAGVFIIGCVVGAIFKRII